MVRDTSALAESYSALESKVYDLPEKSPNRTVSGPFGSIRRLAHTLLPFTAPTTSPSPATTPTKRANAEREHRTPSEYGTQSERATPAAVPEDNRVSEYETPAQQKTQRNVSQPKRTPPTYGLDGNISSSSSEAAEEDGFIEEYPERFRAERKTPQGNEILVEWYKHPDMADWTWELKARLLEDVPSMVQAWEAEKTKTGRKLEYEVEALLDKKRIKGEERYLVKWVGFNKLKDRTWEPASLMRADVPYLAEEFEREKGAPEKSKQKQRRGRKVTRRAKAS